MSWRTTGILFVVLLILVGVVYWQSQQEEEAALAPTAVAPGPAAPNPFEGLTAENVERLEIQLEGAEQRPASFRREEDGAWYMIAPTSTQVISSTLTNTMRTLIGAGSRRALSPEENPLDVYGLETPGRSVTFAVRRDQDLVQVRVLIGNSTPADDAYYTIRQGDPRIYLINKSALDNVLGLASEPPLPDPASLRQTPTTTP